MNLAVLQILKLMHMLLLQAGRGGGGDGAGAAGHQPLQVWGAAQASAGAQLRGRGQQRGDVQSPR